MRISSSKENRDKKETQRDEGFTYCLDYNNKDHQRMMVDQMFMIVQSLRSFLTAVTTTAVAPIAIIIPVFTLTYMNVPEFT